MAARADGGARRPARQIAARTDLRHILRSAGWSVGDVVSPAKRATASKSGIRHSRTRPGNMQSRLRSSGLSNIAEKLDAGNRLTLDDGVRLFECPDLLVVGY